MPRVVRFVHRRSELLVDLVLPSLACLVSASTHQIPGTNGHATLRGAVGSATSMYAADQAR
jgi:hypothetical protein